MDGCTYFSESHNHCQRVLKWEGLLEHRLAFIGGISQLLVTAADLGDCVCGQVQQSVTALAACLKLWAIATRDTCNLSPL